MYSFCIFQLSIFNFQFFNNDQVDMWCRTVLIRPAAGGTRTRRSLIVALTVEILQSSTSTVSLSMSTISKHLILAISEKSRFFAVWGLLVYNCKGVYRLLN